MRVVFFFFFYKKINVGMIFFFFKDKKITATWGCLIFIYFLGKHIVILKKWVSGRVFLFYRQCFSAS